MTTTRRDFVIGTGATLAAATLTRGRRRLAGRRCQEPARGDHRRTADRLSGKRHVARHRHRRTRRAQVEAVRSLGRGPEDHRGTRRGRLERLKAIDPAALGSRHAYRRGRHAHRARIRARRVRLSVRRRRAAQFELVVAQRAVRGRPEHRRLPRNSEHARRAAHGDLREDADAYLARIEAYAGQIDGETEKAEGARPRRT